MFGNSPPDSHAPPAYSAFILLCRSRYARTPPPERRHRGADVCRDSHFPAIIFMYDSADRVTAAAWVQAACRRAGTYGRVCPATALP